MAKDPRLAKVGVSGYNRPSQGQNERGALGRKGKVVMADKVATFQGLLDAFIQQESSCNRTGKSQKVKR